MNYYIDIIDTLDDTHTTVLEHASANSIVLNYFGSDEKDALNIVGSKLKFDLEVAFNNDNTDAAFSHLFTGDEQRYRIELKKEADDSIIWIGFLLPESYSEPYKQGVFYPKFESTDGLGRLKGKYLEDSFYTDEKNVVAIISACLLLTGLELPLFFAPGVDNYDEKNWHNIYVDTSIFIKKDKKQDAYKIISTITKDLVSVVFQSLGSWYIEGLNKRNLLVYASKKYDASGTFIEDLDITRLVKTINASLLATPEVTIVPPYKKISVSQERSILALPETIVKEKNEGWVIVTGVRGEIYTTDWSGHNDFYAKSLAPQYTITLEASGVASVDLNKYVSLRQKIYVKANTKLKFSAEFEINFDGDSISDLVDDAIMNNRWKNPMYYQIKLNDTVLFTNYNTALSFNQLEFQDNKQAELGFEFITTTSGLIDIVLFQPFGLTTLNYIESITINDVVLEIINQPEEYYVEDILEEEYTTEKEIELIIADDATGISPSFLLAPLRVADTNFVSIDVPILYGFTLSGKNYSVVQLDGANLISDNVNTVYKDAVLLEDIIVTYNFNNGEQMVINTPVLYDTGSFIVRVYEINDYTASRSNWEVWTDSLYRIERERFADVVLNIHRRLFTYSHQKVDATVQQLLLFNDIIKWNYIAQANYVILNMNLNFDSGETSFTMAKAAYLSEGTENIPPFVNAGPDIFIDETTTQVFVDAEAYDPDGFIVSYLWEKIQGDAGDVIESVTSEDTSITNLTGNLYEFSLTVEDNDGATAFDIMRVIRIINYNIDFVFNASESTTGTTNAYHWYDLVVSPNIPADEILTFNGEVTLATLIGGGATMVAQAYFKLVKNGVALEEYLVTQGDSETFELLFNYISTDVIYIAISAVAYDPDGISPDASAQVDFNIETVEFIDYTGNITGVPIFKTLRVDA